MPLLKTISRSKNSAINFDFSTLFYTPAKVNFKLSILSQDKSGLHQVEMDMIPIDLCDQILIFPAAGEAWQSNNSPAGEMIKQAINIFSEAVGKKINIDFRIVKHIPHQAGLGGSSGNAAGVLRFLCEHAFDIGWARITDLALSLGHDCPFFLNPQASIAKGYGELLEPMPQFLWPSILIAKPIFNISTADAYKTSIPAAPIKVDYNKLATYSPEINGFWGSALPHFQELSNLRSTLLSFPQVSNLFMSGSGSSLILLFNGNESRDEFMVQDHGLGYKLYSCNLLNQFKYSFTKFAS